MHIRISDMDIRKSKFENQEPGTWNLIPGSLSHAPFTFYLLPFAFVTAPHESKTFFDAYISVKSTGGLRKNGLNFALSFALV